MMHVMTNFGSNSCFDLQWTRLSSSNLFSMAQPAVYHSAVPSIATLHPNLPQSLIQCLHLDQEIAQGDIQQNQLVEESEHVAAALSSIHANGQSHLLAYFHALTRPYIGYELAVTCDVKATAINRAVTLRNTRLYNYLYIWGCILIN